MTEKSNSSQGSEIKEEKKSSEVFKTALKIALGGIIFLIGVWAVIGWWEYLWQVFKGCIGIFLILAGLITIAIAKE